MKVYFRFLNYDDVEELIFQNFNSNGTIHWNVDNVNQFKCNIQGIRTELIDFEIPVFLSLTCVISADDFYD